MRSIGMVACPAGCYSKHVLECPIEAFDHSISLWPIRGSVRLLNL